MFKISEVFGIMLQNYMRLEIRVCCKISIPFRRCVILTLFYILLLLLLGLIVQYIESIDLNKIKKLLEYKTEFRNF